MSDWTLPRIRERLGEWATGQASDAAAAAVAAILREGTEGAELLFIKRAEREGDPWSGHLAFPGGKREPGDESLLVTSIRETQEEVGLRMTVQACLARLEDVHARSNGYRVAQFVFELGPGEIALQPSAEVSATLWVPLGRLARGEGAGTMTYDAAGTPIELPCFHLGAYVLWGMTYRMVMQLLEAVALQKE